MVRVPLNDILFVEGLKDYISVTTINEKLITLQNLRGMEDALPTNQFMRVHKSYIVAINKIDTVEKSRIFIGDEVLPIGDYLSGIFFLQELEINDAVFKFWLKGALHLLLCMLCK